MDTGHIDSKYEWYKMGATQKGKLPNKHTAEHNEDRDIGGAGDEVYLSEIVERLCD